MTTKAYKIAVIPGDGIGKEVVPEAIRVLEGAGRQFDFACAFDEKDWRCERVAKEGAMMPGDGLAQISNHDAILLGAVGFPGVPDHVSLWGLLIPIRRQFRQLAQGLSLGVPTGQQHRYPGIDRPHASQRFSAITVAQK